MASASPSDGHSDGHGSTPVVMRPPSERNVAKIPEILPHARVFPIQIGSELFKLSGASLSSDAPSYFSQYFLCQMRAAEENGDEMAGAVRTLYIDRDPATFRDIALHLQGYHVTPRDGTHFVRLFSDAQFYSLPKLTSQLFEESIFISIGHREFQIPRDLLTSPTNSPNYFSLGFAAFFTRPDNMFPGLDREGVIRPPAILPPSVPNRSADTFADLLRLLRGYPVEIRDEVHRQELLRDARYFHFKGLEQQLIPHAISYNPLRRRDEIVLRLENVQKSGVSVAQEPPPPPPPPSRPAAIPPLAPPSTARLGAEPSPSPNKRRGSPGRAITGGGTPGQGPDGHTGPRPEPEASSKRARANERPPKILPQRYEQCAVEDMVELIAHMLAELIATNDAIRISSGGLTRFHSRTAPGISVRDYLHRLARHATLTPPLLLAMVYYIDRLCALYPEFTINTLTVHRFLITAATVAAKGLSDSFWNNTTYARVGGVRVAELKLLELEFLYRVDWKIVPNPEVLVAYYRGLVERTPAYALQLDESSGDDMDDDDDDNNNGDHIDDAATAPEGLP
ncbi:hypothetical protein CDD83_285 [Cordyceps sp. RAO-2017]|nr:hypothetical protein CDD83_285 [Cordyceps sp. RAO-2017]